MIRFIAAWWAKRNYIFKQEVEAATAELHAGLSTKLAGEKRALIAQLNREADDIDASIKAVDEQLAKGYWECECGKEDLIAPAVTQAEGHHIFCECGKPMNLVCAATMTAQEKTQSDRERNDAQTIAANKRAQAKAEEENAAGSEQTVQYFKKQAASNRQVADRIRSL